MLKLSIRTGLAILGISIATAGSADISTSSGAVSVSKIVSGLDAPWGFGFLPEGALLITQQNGRLLFAAPGESLQRVRGVPNVVDVGQGGLLDVMIPRDFEKTRDVYLTLATKQGRGAGTAVARGNLSADGRTLRNAEIIFEMASGSSGGRHFGSRLVEAPDGTLFLTIGDRGDRPSAQDLSRENGSVVRINRDGSIPKDNPFAMQAGAQPGIYSYGHRNAQGAAIDASGQLWIVEHGARGGDEVNRVERGVNYGWPVISYGRHYSGAKIGEGTSKAGMAQPVHYWDPSIAPSGMLIYSGKLWPEWKGDFFTGSLNSDLVIRLDRNGSDVTEAERWQSDETLRVRDIREAPDGAIWFMSAGNGAIYRITP